MALSTEEQNFVSRVQRFSRLLKDEYGEVVALNALWYGAEADYNDQITDEELDTIPSLAHITQAQLNEILYIVGQLKPLLDARLEQIAVVAQ